MSETFTPLLSNTDWNDEWKTLQKQRRRFDDAKYWDKRAPSFTVKDAPSAYVSEFLHYAAIQPDEKVFDMGCGSGALSLPLAEANHQVIAADFSQGMLDKMKGEIDERNILGITQLLMSWSDDWGDYGLGKNCVDVALASRSIATDDIKQALLKLTEVAKRRVYVTLSTGSSPRIDKRILDVAEIKLSLGYDYQYALNILINEGFEPSLSYIESARHDTFESFEDAFDSLFFTVTHSGANLDEQQLTVAEKRVRTWLEDHLIDNPHALMPDSKGEPQKAYCLDKPRIVTWAFISWDTTKK